MRHTRWIPALFVAAVSITAGCGTSTPVVATEAQPTVNRMLAADAIERWTFTYQPDSASPYLACLGGIDGIRGAIDVTAKVLRLEPYRDAPPVIVTDTAVLVPSPNGSQTWLEAAWTPTLDTKRLEAIFGDALAGYIATGLRAPDLNMTTAALVDIAWSVEATDPPFQLAGDAIRITVDADRYLRELEANAIDISDDERGRVPTFIAVVDSRGRVSALVVDGVPSRPDRSEADHADRYIVTAQFKELDPIATALPEDRELANLADITYPTPDASCKFGL